jgi:hypothetical protein
LQTPELTRSLNTACKWKHSTLIIATAETCRRLWILQHPG